MYTLEKTFRFEAAHSLPTHDGKCRRLHGHSWVAVVVFDGDDVCRIGPKRAMLVDYGDISDLVKPLVDEFLDHHHLNETLFPFGVESPTSEAIAKWLYDQIAERMGNGYWPARLNSVRIEETCTSRCIYHPGCVSPINNDDI